MSQTVFIVSRPLLKKQQRLTSDLCALFDSDELEGLYNFLSDLQDAFKNFDQIVLEETESEE